MDSLDSIKAFVRQTQALTILPTWTVKRELQKGTLKALPLGRKPVQQAWGFSHWRDRPLNHSEASFLQLCRSALVATTQDAENLPTQAPVQAVQNE
jgi:DNA-binding transcriptional LysR family regulator